MPCFSVFFVLHIYLSHCLGLRRGIFAASRLGFYEFVVDTFFAPWSFLVRATLNALCPLSNHEEPIGVSGVLKALWAIAKVVPVSAPSLSNCLLNLLLGFPTSTDEVASSENQDTRIV